MLLPSSESLPPPVVNISNTARDTNLGTAAVGTDRRIDSRIPYLDGLRGYSILVVLLSHSDMQQHWLGTSSFLRPFIDDSQLAVRIFFVLSGFLITTLLLREKDATGKISIRGFYERRIARIFPEYYLYLTLVVAGTLIGILKIQPIKFLPCATFTQNYWYVFMHFAPKFKTPDDSEVIGHFWTLSLEEQFYFVWPSCLVFLGLVRSRWVALCGVLLLPVFRGVLAISSSRVRGAVAWSFVPDLILIGVLAAFAARDGWIEKFGKSRFRAAFPWIAGFTIYFVCPRLGTTRFLILDASIGPSLQGLSVVVFIFWLLSGKGGFLRRILESWPAVQLGLISYTLYVWQNPFTLWSGLNWIRFPLNLLPPLVVSIICYRFWEVPMRKFIRARFHQGALSGASQLL